MKKTSTFLCIVTLAASFTGAALGDDVDYVVIIKNDAATPVTLALDGASCTAGAHGHCEWKSGPGNHRLDATAGGIQRTVTFSFTTDEDDANFFACDWDGNNLTGGSCQN
jgi:hypothetical protein